MYFIVDIILFLEYYNINKRTDEIERKQVFRKRGTMRKLKRIEKGHYYLENSGTNVSTGAVTGHVYLLTG